MNNQDQGDEEIVQVTGCPACGFLGGDAIGEIAPHFAVRYLDVASDLEQPDYSIIRCSACSLYYKSARLSDAALRQYYNKLPHEQFETSFLMKTDLEVVKILSSAPKDARIMDYGCGVGRILEAAGGGRHVYGVEINVRSAAIAACKGIQMLTENDLTSRMPGAFDYIILCDVYEHLIHPMETLRMLYDCLGPGGRLIIVTGNADAFPHGSLFAQFWYFRIPGHVQALGRTHVEWIAAQLALTIEHCKLMSHYDVSMVQRVLEKSRSWLFEQFHLHPGAPLTRFLSLLPVVRRASKWHAAPAVTFTRDHLIVVLKKN